jgi:hypothetical protein
MCRKWSGSPHLSIKQADGVEIEGLHNVEIYQSSDWAERAFCKSCGTHLFYRVISSGETFVSAGLLDDASGFVMDHQIFIDEKPHYYSFSQRTHNMTGAEVFAAFAPPADD